MEARTYERPRRPTRSVPAIPQPTLEEIAIALTPLRAHYLKKTLIQLQFQKELAGITSSPTPIGSTAISTLSYLGPPFYPPPKDAPNIDLPFLRFIFRKFVVTFPFVSATPKEFWSVKLQPFVSSVLARNLNRESLLDGNDVQEKGTVTTSKFIAKIERNLSLFIGAGTKLVEPEQVVRLKQSDLDRLEALSEKRMKRFAKVTNFFEVNITGVRTVTDKGRIRSRIHEEFLIRTRRTDFADIYVSRRYGDFKTLADELRKHHPEELIKPPPAKDRTVVSGALGNTAPTETSVGASDSSDSLNSASATSIGLAREKNRLTLRAYLHYLMSFNVIASSPVLRSFLTMGETTLTPEELQDALRREEADRMREEGRKRFAKEIASRVDALRDAVRSVKGDIMGPDGLTQVFATIKTHTDVQTLPENYRAVLEWARVSLASTVFYQFIASDNASESFASLKRTHGLMPYFLLKGILNIANPVAMIRGILNLFMAQPFGGRSLLQRIFTVSIAEEVTALTEDINVVVEKIEDPLICEKIKRFVYAPREIQDMFKADAAEENIDILTVVLRSGDEPALDRQQIQRVFRARKAHIAYLKHRQALDDSDDDDGPEDHDAWLFEDARVLTHLYSRLRDREQMMALIFEGNTSELLKDIITMFYAPLATVYKAASISESLGDLQNFINDLIRTVEASEQYGQDDPNHTVQTFIDLVARHEQSFYSFVHKVHSKGEGLFDGLMKWIELFITVAREGLGNPVSLEFLLPHAGVERVNILAEVDAVALYHYKLKVAYEGKLRRRFGRAQESAEAEGDAANALVNDISAEFNFDAILQGDAAEVAAEDMSESESDSSEYQSETEEENADGECVLPGSSSPSGSRRNPQRVSADVRHQSKPRSKSLHGRGNRDRSSRRQNDLPPIPSMKSDVSANDKDKLLPPIPGVLRQSSSIDNLALPKSQNVAPLEHMRLKSRLKHKGKPEAIIPPNLEHIPKLLPVFTELLRPLLQPSIARGNRV